MYQEQDVAAGVWWRFSKYILDNGMIRAAPGADLIKCDPWADFRQAHAGIHGAPEGKRQMDPPYKSLINLVERSRVSEPHESEILQWCAGHGLLGLLPHRALSATMVARWSSLMDNPTATMFASTYGFKKGDLLPTVSMFYRTNTGWNEYIYQSRPVKSPRSAKRGEIVLDRYLSPDCPRPGVVLQDLGDFRIIQEPITSSWSQYFPEMPDWMPHPPLLSDDFWKIYGEPVHEFLGGAVMLSRAIKMLTKARGQDVREMSQEDQFEFDRAFKEFNALLSGVSPAVLAPEPRALKQSWTSKSLIGSLAMMALIDLTAGNIYSCQNETCGRTFVTTAYQATYCSPRCRNTSLHREMRHKKKALELWGRRIPIKKIAKQVGVSIEAVKKWISL